MYTQAFFAFDRVKQLAAANPEFKVKQPYRAILEGDQATMARFGSHEIVALIATTHSGMTPDEFNAWRVPGSIRRGTRDFISSSRSASISPSSSFWYISGQAGSRRSSSPAAGSSSSRAFTEGTYGIPPEQVIGSSTKTRFELRDGKAVLVKLPELNSIDDKEGKPININLHIGRRPILAFGNSDGDLEMLEYTASGPGPRLMLLLHHDDAAREYAYDRKSRVGRLDLAWDEAVKHGWLVVSMKRRLQEGVRIRVDELTARQAHGRSTNHE